MKTDGIKGVGRRKLPAHLVGMTVDFVTNLESSGFAFDNSNARDKCACGKSFGQPPS